ncbi:Pyridoxal-phosphate-dependent serine hydroxymethyltransferase [Candidatus Hepatoplasma crinochetorum Av]|uniref:Serine hydroxymethyltransferase n=1 Tax=Candidatus Hepatoplasma crinochetorum Av TaxID=1427984 RepID=W8GS21_9MOLU|nr:serine hydroxymethyltransferase [Candidatus Hepatoplasma crinochetorum]AHK22235.1 Pyridoxal-phosphate-dependent serine hydroxymethyltransferase [Candidatus Hepatoplasma crinochetorum Av]
MKDKEIENLILLEKKRQENEIELIASENFVSNDVLKATGSILTNKYAEGYPNNRYYEGCENVDKIETLAIERLKKLFNAKYANVQPHSGTQANLAAYNALIKPGSKILGLSLSSGGHLSHGFKITMSGIFYDSYTYEVDKKTNLLDYEKILEIAKEVKPDLIICGYSAYPRIIDFKKFRNIADQVGAYLLADIAHIAGLIAAKLHPNPLDFGVDIVTSTTHKTLRGPRGGIILTNKEEIFKKINSSVFPGSQGGPLMHVIAAKAVAFREALDKSFISYQKQVIKNAKALANRLIEHNVKITTNGTDNHLMLIDVKKSFNITGQEAEKILKKHHITINKNAIPFDPLSPKIASGIRLGTPAMTTRGWKEKDFIALADKIYNLLKS